MSGDYTVRIHNAATLLAARISAAVLAVLDESAPSFWDTYDSASESLQGALEDEIARQVSRWLSENSS